MNLAKLFVIFAILLIATLGQTEGRRRWFKRKYKTIGCAGRKKLSSAVNADLNDSHHREGVNNDVDFQHNATERNYRKSNKWAKLKCGGNRCVDNVSTIKLTDNSTDSEISNHNEKVPKRSRNNRRGHCRGGSRRWRFNKVAVIEGSNSTRSEVPVDQNLDEQNRNRNKNRKCKGRRARKGKCQRLETHDSDPNLDEQTDVEGSIENELHQVAVTTTETPRDNVKEIFTNVY